MTHSEWLERATAKARERWNRMLERMPRTRRVWLETFIAGANSKHKSWRNANKA